MKTKTLKAAAGSAITIMILAATLAGSGCSGEPLSTREKGTIGGAAVGAAGGALVGAAVGAPGAGAAIGGAAGGVTGYAIGNHIQNEQDRRGDY
jgi:osmotically inducible lipoprotein OsmB